MAPDDEDLERIAEEALGDVEYFQIAPGPNGPWHYGITEIRRRRNTIYLSGEGIHNKIEVDGGIDKRALMQAIEDVNTDALNEL